MTLRKTKCKNYHALHRENAEHAGIVTCTRDADVAGLAGRVHAAIGGRVAMVGEVVRVVRGSGGR